MGASSSGFFKPVKCEQVGNNIQDVGPFTYNLEGVCCINESLHSLVLQGDIDAARMALCQGADVNFQNKDGFSALHIAATVQSKEMVQLLVDGIVDEGEADLNALNQEGFSPLHITILNNNACIVKYMLDKGAHLLGKTLSGLTPLELAMGNEKMAAAEVIRNKLEIQLPQALEHVEDQQNQLFFLNGIRSFQRANLCVQHQRSVCQMRCGLRSIGKLVDALATDKIDLGMRPNIEILDEQCVLKSERCRQKTILQKFYQLNENVKAQIGSVHPPVHSQSTVDDQQLKIAIQFNAKPVTEKFESEQIDGQLQDDVSQLLKEIVKLKQSGSVMMEIIKNIQKFVEELLVQVTEVIAACQRKEVNINLERTAEIKELQATIYKLQQLCQSKKVECTESHQKLYNHQEPEQNLKKQQQPYYGSCLDKFNGITQATANEEQHPTHSVRQFNKQRFQSNPMKLHDTIQLRPYYLSSISGESSMELTGLNNSFPVTQFNYSNNAKINQQTRFEQFSDYEGQLTPRSPILILSDSDASSQTEIEEVASQSNDLNQQDTTLYCYNQNNQKKCNVQQFWDQQEDVQKMQDFQGNVGLTSFLEEQDKCTIQQFQNQGFFSEQDFREKIVLSSQVWNKLNDENNVLKCQVERLGKQLHGQTKQNAVVFQQLQMVKQEKCDLQQQCIKLFQKNKFLHKKLMLSKVQKQKIDVEVGELRNKIEFMNSESCKSPSLYKEISKQYVAKINELNFANKQLQDKLRRQQEVKHVAVDTHDFDDAQESELLNLRQEVCNLSSKNEELHLQKQQVETDLTDQIKCLQTQQTCTKSVNEVEVCKKYRKLTAEYDKINEFNKTIVNKLRTSEKAVQDLRIYNDSLVLRIKKGNCELQKAEMEQRKLQRFCWKSGEALDIAQKEKEKLLYSLECLSKEKKYVTELPMYREIQCKNQRRENWLKQLVKKIGSVHCEDGIGTHKVSQK